MVPGVRDPIDGVCYMPPDSLQHYIDAGALTRETLVDAFRAAAARFPDRVALSELDMTLSYAQLDRQSDRAAAAFAALGLKPLDRVIFQIANSKELVLAFLGCLKAGLIPICTLTAHRSSEIGQIGRQANARAHIVSARVGSFDLAGFAGEMRAQIPSIKHSIVVGGQGPLPDGCADFDAVLALGDGAPAPAAPDDPFQVAVFQLSGGTSGVPKIIPRFHSEYLYSIRTVIDWHGFDETLVAFTPNPMMHNAPMICFWLPALLTGGEVAIAPPDIDAIGKVLNQRRPTWSLILPVHLKRLQEAGHLDDAPLAGAYGIVAMAGALELSRLFGAPAYCIYGMSEGLLTFTRRGDPLEAVRVSVGRPLSALDEVRLVEPGTERDVMPGAVGELLVRGPSTIVGYFDAPDRNAEAFTSDGYYRSGDLMSHRAIEGRHYLRFEGRVKDLVDRGGEKINCAEVELAIGQHGDVASVLCVGMPDPVYGERLCACIIMRPGAADAMTVASVGAHLGQVGLAKYKYPERVEIMLEFPLTSSGKPSKPLLRELVVARVNGVAQSQEVA